METLIKVDFRNKMIISKTAVSFFDHIKERLLDRFDDIPSQVLAAWKAGAIHNEPYGFGCSHNIQWTSRIRNKCAIWNAPIPYPLEMDLATNHIGKDVRYGGTDPLMWMDRKYRNTYEFIKARQGKPLTIETRSDLIATDEYLEVLDKSYHEIIIWVNNLTSDELRNLEPGAPSNERRLAAAYKLQSLGYKVKVRKQLIKLKRKAA